MKRFIGLDLGLIIKFASGILITGHDATNITWCACNAKIKDAHWKECEILHQAVYRKQVNKINNIAEFLSSANATINKIQLPIPSEHCW